MKNILKHTGISTVNLAQNERLKSVTSKKLIIDANPGLQTLLCRIFGWRGFGVFRRVLGSVTPGKALLRWTEELMKKVYCQLQAYRLLLAHFSKSFDRIVESYL